MSLSEGALKAFEMLKQACMNSLVLAFADYTKDFLLETRCLEGRIGEQFSLRNRKMDSFTWWPTATGHSPCMRRITILPN